MLNVYNNTTIKWKNKGKEYCLHIQTDDLAESPRSAFDSFTTIACFHGRYSLGDKDAVKRGTSPLEFLQELVRKNVKEKDIFKAAVGGKLKSVRLEKNGEALYDLYMVTQYRTVFGNSEAEETLEYEGVNAGNAVYYIIDSITIEDCLYLLQPVAEILPLWLYDHSGLTMSCGERNPYNCPWDSGQVGWIIGLKADAMKWFDVGETEWRERTREYMKGEVEMYDQYLRGDVFGFTLYEKNSPDEEWHETDASVWGFYGSDIEENGIADEVGRGLPEAIENGDYVDGEASYKVSRQIVL